MIYMFIDTGLKGRVCGAAKKKKAVLVLSTHTSLWCEHAAVRSVLNMWLEETKNETKTMATAPTTKENLLRIKQNFLGF